MKETYGEERESNEWREYNEPIERSLVCVFSDGFVGSTGCGGTSVCPVEG